MIRILKVEPTQTGYEFNNPSWTVVCVCSDGVSRVTKRFLSFTTPHVQMMQEYFNRFPQLFEEIS